MRIGSVEIEGVERRFWFILGAVVLLLGLGFYLWGKRPSPPPPNTMPAFDPKLLAKLPDDWFEEQVKAYGLRTAASTDELTSGYVQNLGQPFRLKVMIASQEDAQDRPSLSLRKDGWVFRPAAFLPPTQAQNQDSLEQKLSELTDGQPLMLGFPEGAQPAAEGGPYEIAGMLWWRSDAFNPPTEEDEMDMNPAPILLVPAGRFEPLSRPELEAPTTHRADIDLTLRAGPFEIAIPRVEWSSGHELRACVIVRNLSGRPQQQWPGIAASSAQIGEGGSVSEGSAPEEGYSLAEQSELSPNQAVAGYVNFPGLDVVGAPNEILYIELPSLSPLQDPGAFRQRIAITPEQFADVAAGSRRAELTPDCADARGARDIGLRPVSP